MALYDLLTILLILLPPLAFIVIISSKKMGRKCSKPPCPPKLPILGNLHQLSALPHRSLWKLSKKYGPVMQFNLGRIQSVIISSAEAAKQVMKVNDLASCSRPPMAGTRRLTYNYLDVAFAPYGDHWRFMRKMIILELFSLKRVKSFRFIREEEVGLLIDSLIQQSSSSAEVNLTDKLFSLTANITFRMSFGFNYHGTDFDKDAFHEMVHQAAIVTGTISAQESLPLIGWIVDRFTGLQARTDRVFHELDNFFQHVIDEHLKPGREKADEEDDMIDVLLAIITQQSQSQSDQSQPQLTINNIKALLLDFFLGGIDTAAITVNWAMAELLANPILMQKAQAEVRRQGGRDRVGKMLTEDDVNNFDYLKMIIKETLRLHPPAPLLVPRESISPMEICGYQVQPNTMIYVNAWGIGRDPNHWEDAEKFIPERFINNSVDFRGQNFEYLPFGSGRRICPGIHMGNITVEIALANLLYCFDWKLPSGMMAEDINMEEHSGVSLTVSKKEPLLLYPLYWLSNNHVSP
ncbi:Cytochrome P450 71B10 [Linum grandiflorum]